MKKFLFVLPIFFFLISCKQRKIKKIDNIHELKEKDTSVIQKAKQTSIFEGECSYDNEVSTLGIGLVITPEKFDIYNDNLLNDKFTSWDMYSENKNKESICSKFFNPEYGIMHFVCIGKTSKAYKVLINYSDIKYLPNLKGYDFKDWNEYILQSFGIRRLTNNEDNNLDDQSLRSNRNDNEGSIAIPKGYEMFCPIEIKGDWVKVKYDCFYNSEDNPYEGEPCKNVIDECQNPLTGWLRWKQANKILIDIFLMP